MDEIWLIEQITFELTANESLGLAAANFMQMICVMHAWR